MERFGFCSISGCKSQPHSFHDVATSSQNFELRKVTTKISKSRRWLMMPHEIKPQRHLRALYRHSVIRDLVGNVVDGPPIPSLGRRLSRLLKTGSAFPFDVRNSKRENIAKRLSDSTLSFFTPSDHSPVFIQTSNLPDCLLSIHRH